MPAHEQPRGGYGRDTTHSAPGERARVSGEPKKPDKTVGWVSFSVFCARFIVLGRPINNCGVCSQDTTYIISVCPASIVRLSYVIGRERPTSGPRAGRRWRQEADSRPAARRSKTQNAAAFFFRRRPLMSMSMSSVQPSGPCCAFSSHSH